MFIIHLDFKVFKKQIKINTIKWFSDDMYDENNEVILIENDGYEDKGNEESIRYQYESVYDYYTYGEYEEERYMLDEEYLKKNKLFDNMETNIPEDESTQVDYDWAELEFEEVEQIQNEVLICARGQCDDVSLSCCLGDCMYISY